MNAQTFFWSCTYFNLYFNSKLFLLTHNMPVYLVLSVRLKGIWWWIKDWMKNPRDSKLREEFTKWITSRQQAFQLAQDSFCPYTWRSNVAGHGCETLTMEGFWLAEVQYQELEGKENHMVYSSTEIRLSRENMKETCKTSWDLWFPTNGFVLSTDTVLKVICCMSIWVCMLYLIQNGISRFCKVCYEGKINSMESTTVQLKQT